MGKRGKFGNKHYSKRRIRSKERWSDESDVDYSMGEDEEFNDSEDYCSLFGEESEESLDDFEEEEEEMKVRKIGRSKRRKVFPDRWKNEAGKAHKKRRATVEDEEDFEVEEYDNEKEQKKRRPKLENEKDFDVEEYCDKEVQKKRRPKLEDDEDFEVEDYEEEDEEVEEEVEEKISQKRRASYKVDEEEDFEDEDFDDDDDDDDDDEEFAPEDDDLDDEDMFAVRKKNKRVGRRPSLIRNGHVKERKRKRSCRFMGKPARKNRRKSLVLRRKSAAGNGGAFTKNPVVKERSKRSSGRRKRKFMADPDSDFMISGSSDYKYSISEEEREQVREANTFCRDLTINLRNPSSTKRSQEGVVCQQRKVPGRKGKEKVEELNVEAWKQVCGICLSEEGKTTVRGTLNCCSHYFCFGCIMEWSKVESRCPLCKQRFMNISKPARSNAAFDLRTVVVQVPERNQVYQPSEEELRGYLDPYESVICSECQQGGDDAFMLLCDICDSPVHTYCVGLGREVPEGNWYCEGCRPTALNCSNPQSPNLNSSNRSFPDFNIREAIDLNSEYVPESPQSTQAGSPVSGVGVSTLSQRRRILQIQHLLNNGISQFGGRTNWVSAAASGNNVLGSQITPERFPPQPTISQGRRLQGNLTPSTQSRDLVSATTSRSRDQLIRCHTSTPGDGSVNRMMPVGFAGISRGVNSSGGRTNWASATNSGNNVLGSQITPEMFSPQQILSQGSLQGNVTPSMQIRDLSWVNSSRSSDQLFRGQTSTSGDGAVNRMMQAGLAGINRGINSSLGYEQLRPYSTSRSSITEDSVAPYGYREASHSNSEKEQVKSMVKSHLKSVSREVKLGYSTFKDIARNSTHTILAACGLQHRGSSIYPVQPPSICDHVDAIASGEISLIKGCCSSCFDSFVSCVVREITNTESPPPVGVRVRN